MLKFTEHKWSMVLVTLLLLISCLLQITSDMKLHDFTSFQSHHGLLIFSTANLIYQFNELKRSLK